MEEEQQELRVPAEGEAQEQEDFTLGELMAIYFVALLGLAILTTDSGASWKSIEYVTAVGYKLFVYIVVALFVSATVIPGFGEPRI